ncbi:MAG: YifB family Mg chelatase-like AAA ATPase [Bacteroidales bacterium]|nr:YifB family Mg chelatase-like AAA ATPase [Bacteroidales bacterium]
MLCKVFCACCTGLEAVIITVEADVTPGISFYLVGLPDSAVKESQQRISTALTHYGYRIPGRRIVINMAPANIRKEGSAFDIAIAIGIICASGQIPQGNIPQERLNSFLIMGELALDGNLRTFSGALPIAIKAAETGFSGCIFPYEAARECAEIDNIAIFAAKDIKDVIDILSSPEESQHLLATNIFNRPSASCNSTDPKVFEYDFADVKGQLCAKTALEIAAAGSHNIILAGSPGCGKTFMAKCLPSIMPPLSREESIETSKIYSISGMLQTSSGFMKERPFRAPHHTSTASALIGGGHSSLPGEISLAHNGILLLDEFCEFSRNIIETLRQPMEEGTIQISRVKQKYLYPANFMLVATMNPCPCGFYGSSQHHCNCSAASIIKYNSRISGPILDRIDLHVFVNPVETSDLLENRLEKLNESSHTIAQRVAAAREIQYERFKNKKYNTNSNIPASKIDHYCSLGLKERNYIKGIISKLGLSARSYTRILKISRTIADLDGKDFISLEHISKALQYRGGITHQL